MTYLCGQAVTCALNPQSGCARQQPKTLDFTFLHQAQQAKYYRAFAETSLSRAAVADLAETHLRRAA